MNPTLRFMASAQSHRGFRESPFSYRAPRKDRGLSRAASPRAPPLTNTAAPDPRPFQRSAAPSFPVISELDVCPKAAQKTSKSDGRTLPQPPELACAILAHASGKMQCLLCYRYDNDR